MEETEKAPVAGKFRQGDILKLYGTSHADFGVVINADCDLANDKNDGHIAYIPLFTFKDFINRFWFADEIKNIKSQSETALARLLNSTTEVQALTDWLNQEDPEEVFQKLKPALPLKKGEPDELQKHIKRLNACIKEQGLDALRIIYSLEKNPEKHAETQLTKLKTNLGEGHMMISCIVGLSDLGFVLRMKRVFSIDQNYCFKTASDHLANSTDDNAIAAVRIARLTPTYKYKAAQVFATSFSRIGLSNEISKLNDLAILDIAQNLKDVKNV